MDGESASVGWFVSHGAKLLLTTVWTIATCHVPGYWRVTFRYPLVNVYITMEMHHAIHGTTHNFYCHVQWLCCYVKLPEGIWNDLTFMSQWNYGNYRRGIVLNLWPIVWFMWLSSHWIVIVQPDLWLVFRLSMASWDAPGHPHLELQSQSVMVMTTRWLRMG